MPDQKIWNALPDGVKQLDSRADLAQSVDDLRLIQVDSRRPSHGLRTRSD